MKSPPETVILVIEAAITLLGDKFIDWKSCLAI
jgi:hypothetical protein